MDIFDPKIDQNVLQRAVYIFWILILIVELDWLNGVNQQRKEKAVLLNWIKALFIQWLYLVAIQQLQ